MKNLCRCGHWKTMHFEEWYGVLAYTCNGYKINNRCLCREYIPSDNLEYLEQLNDKAQS